MEELDPTLETFVQESFRTIFDRVIPEGEEESTAKTISIALKIFTFNSPQPIEIKASFDAKLLLVKDEEGNTFLDGLNDIDNDDDEIDDLPKGTYRLEIIIQLFSSSKPELEFSRTFQYSASKISENPQITNKEILK